MVNWVRNWDASVESAVLNFSPVWWICVVLNRVVSMGPVVSLSNISSQFLNRMRLALPAHTINMIINGPYFGRSARMCRDHLPPKVVRYSE